jgi:hypothetical protein
MRGLDAKGIALKGICSVFALASALSCGTKAEDNDPKGPAGNASAGNANAGNATGGTANAGNATGGTANAGAGNPFLAPWTCPYMTNSGFTSSTPMVFSLDDDGTLSSTSTINTTPCTLRWTTSGTTATAVSGQMCGAFEVTSYTLELEGDVAFFVAHAIQHARNIAPDGSTSPLDLAGSFSGFCTNDDKPNATVEPICKVDPVVGCGANRAGYRCLGVDSPEDFDSALSCPVVFTAGSACCTLGPEASTCQSDATVTCTGDASGYSCSGPDTPAQANTVVCEPGKARGSVTTYCCGAYAASACTHSTTITGCPDYAFSCTGAAKPWETDSRLRCEPGSESIGSTLFCCSVRDPSIADTCAADPTLECDATSGYSCTGTDAPSDEDPSLTCGEPTPFDGKSLYCCQN